MTNVLHLRIFVLAIVLGTTACASLRSTTTSSDEWLTYRKTRVSPTFEGRIVAAARYLARYPDGAFSAQTRTFYQVAEPIDGLPQHGLLAHQGEQLLGHVGAAGRPESSAGAAGHDNCVKHCAGRGDW